MTDLTVRESVVWQQLWEAWFCAPPAATLNTAAYSAEIVAGAIKISHGGAMGCVIDIVEAPRR